MIRMSRKKDFYHSLIILKVVWLYPIREYCLSVDLNTIKAFIQLELDILFTETYKDVLNRPSNIWKIQVCVSENINPPPSGGGGCQFAT